MAGEEFDLYAMADGADAQLKQKALVDALRAKIQGQQQQADFGRAWGNMGMLSGDKVLGAFGQQQGVDARHSEDLARMGEGRLAEAGQFTAGAPGRRLAQALQQAQLGKHRRDEAEETAPANSMWGELAKKFGMTLPLGLTNRQAKEAVSVAERAYAAEQLGQERQDRAGMARTKDLDDQVLTLSKRLEAAPAIRQDLATLTGQARADDIPGVGSGMGVVPNLFVSEDGVKVRQAVKGLYSRILQEQSGSTVSEQELKRKLDELGMGPNASEEEFRLGLERLTQMAKDSLRTKEAGAKPEAVEEARRRGMTTSADLPSYSAGETGGLTPEQVARRNELRKKKAAGTLK